MEWPATWQWGTSKPPSPSMVIIAIMVSGAIASILWTGVGANYQVWSLAGLNAHHSEAGHVGAVACETDTCTQIATQMLQKGGNAADALVAAQFCLGVISMYHTGIGGGGVALVRDKRGNFETISFKETAPAASTEDMFVNNVNASLYGGLASATPGELRGLEEIHRKYASLSWADLIQPSIDLARHGFRINEDLAGFMEGFSFLVDDPAWSVDFAPNGTLKGLGEILTRKRYANTLETISKKGVDVFYKGDMAMMTIRAIHDAGGIMNLADLEHYKILVERPVTISYRDFILTSNDSPAGGPQSLSMMKTIEGYRSIGWPGALNISTHRLDEAFRFSFGERVNLCDPRFNTSVEPFVKWMLSDSTATQRRNKISDTTTLDPAAYNPTGWVNNKVHGTSAIMTTDASGLTIAWTSTVNGFYGSRVCVPETGVILNNIMNDFANPGSADMFGGPPSPLNYPQPGKRPMGTASNIIVEHAGNRSMFLATGTAGGLHIPTTDILMLWHVLDRNLSANAAIREPRFHDQLSPNVIMADATFNNATIAFLKSRGHNVTFIKPGYAINNAVLRRWDGSFEAATEPSLFNSGAAVV